MDTLLSTLFVFFATLLISATLLIFIRVGFSRLESSIGIHRDGLPISTPAPAWTLPDLRGQRFSTPAERVWQFLIFANKSIAHFPPLIEGMNKFACSKELQVLFISSDSPIVCEAMVRGLDVEVPVISDDDHLYDRFRVRVMPFGFLLDPAGIVRWCGLINTGDDLDHVWKVTYQVTSKLEAVR
jgi:hypothetical protein